MPLTIEERTRVDHLAAQLKQAIAPLTAAAPAPSGAPLFIVHGNGAVYDQKGNMLRDATPPAPVVRK